MSATASLFGVFFLLCAIGAVGGVVVSERFKPFVVAAFGFVSAIVVIAVSALLMVGDHSFHVELWSLMSLGVMQLGADRLSAFFLFVTGSVFLPVSIYSSTYLAKYRTHHSLAYFGVLYNALFASIVLVLIADDVISFLAAWEAMSIASYLLVTFEHRRAESSEAGFLMLAMSQAGTAVVVIAFLLLGAAAPGLDFPSLRAAASSTSYGIGLAVFLLSFVGFAVKAGLTPLNSWLPAAHPVAPTNVSALLSSVIVNLGIYGILRVNMDLHPAPGAVPGLIVLVVGSFSALIGILYATIQAEMKRLLAHSTIENMGIVAAGIGAAMTFMATGHQLVAGIALIAGLYHLANHSVYKALLFIGAGAVDAGAGTRDLDRLGGLARRMPWTSALFLVGVLSISALPPLNGFVSEWLTLQTILRSAILSSIPIKVAFATCGAFLALTAGLAVTCFAKVFAMGFLGVPRSDGAAHAVEANWPTRAALALLALFCILLGVLPTYMIPLIDQALESITHVSAASALVPPFFHADAAAALPASFLAEFHDLGAQVGAGVLPGGGLVVLHRGETANPVVFAMSTSYMLVSLAAILGLVFVVFRVLSRHRALSRGPAWDGGLTHLQPGNTYTATGFSNPVRVIFEAILQPTAGEDNVEAVAQHFRTAIKRNHTDVHIVDRLILDPSIAAISRLANLAQKMHVGNVNAYAAYVLLAMLVVLVIGVGLH